MSLKKIKSDDQFFFATITDVVYRKNNSVAGTLVIQQFYSNPLTNAELNEITDTARSYSTPAKDNIFYFLNLETQKKITEAKFKEMVEAEASEEARNNLVLKWNQAESDSPIYINKSDGIVLTEQEFNTTIKDSEKSKFIKHQNKFIIPPKTLLFSSLNISFDDPIYSENLNEFLEFIKQEGNDPTKFCYLWIKKNLDIFNDWEDC